MAVTITIDMPVAQEARPGVYNVAVTATAMNGVEVLSTRQFASSISNTSAASRAALATTLKDEIVTWKATVVRELALAGALATLKTAIEAGGI